MSIEIVVPRLGWSMDEGTFGQWLKHDGEQVHAGEMLFVLEGEKASQEIESFDAGILHIPQDAPKPGDTIAVGQLLGYLLAVGESAPLRTTGPRGLNHLRDVSSAIPSSTAPPVSHARRAITPRARRKAREMQVDASQVEGSGRNGRIRESDVIAFAGQTPPVVGTSRVPAVSGHEQPASKIRRSIAQRMRASVQQTAPVTLTTKVDATQLQQFRERLKLEQTGEGVPSYADMLMKLVAQILPECPALNACWHNDGVFLYDPINIAFAVDTEDGLVAPVIHHVDKLDLDEIGSQARLLADQARAGTLSQGQLQGGTFTITNLGMFDIDYFTPIINLPQAAILGIGRIVREPVVVGDHIVLGYRLGLSLTFDHRILDGGPAARWLQRLAQAIERPERYLSGPS